MFDFSLQPNDVQVSEPKTNGLAETPTKVEKPQPAPRRINPPNGDVSQAQPPAPAESKTSESQATQNHKKATPTASLEGDDVQVLPKPITNEEFQAMIPAHFLNKSSNPAPEPTQAVTVTIKKPDTIELPPSPTGPGRVTETITKSTFTETVVTRITDNKLVMPLIIEVRQHELPPASISIACLS